jgi:hypothetical protein
MYRRGATPHLRRPLEYDMAAEKAFFESMLDFSFQHCITAGYAKLLYALHLLLGLVVAI